MALTPKQRQAVARAPKRARATMIRNFQRQDRGDRRVGATRQVALSQGVGAVPRRPFGATVGRGLSCWDAFHPSHAPLPRSVGAYTVVRTTGLITSTDPVMIFGTTYRDSNTWSNIAAYGAVNASAAVNAAGNVNVYTVPFPGGSAITGSGLTVVPAAISVQIMNPEALIATTGTVASAVCHTQLDVGGRTETWNDFASEFMSFMKPRLMSAGKLALRGVQMNSYPLNMNILSAFEPMVLSGPSTTTWTSSNSFGPKGFAPMVVVNPQSVSLNYLVSVEWRVRFDIGNPAVSSHQHHGITPDSVWDGMVRAATAMGNGVRDIADIVSAAGQAAGAIRNARAAMPMLVD